MGAPPLVLMDGFDGFEGCLLFCGLYMGEPASPGALWVERSGQRSPKTDASNNGPWGIVFGILIQVCYQNILERTSDPFGGCAGVTSVGIAFHSVNGCTQLLTLSFAGSL